MGPGGNEDCCCEGCDEMPEGCTGGAEDSDDCRTKFSASALIETEWTPAGGTDVEELGGPFGGATIGRDDASTFGGCCVVGGRLCVTED